MLRSLPFVTQSLPTGHAKMSRFLKLRPRKADLIERVNGK